MGLQLVKSKMLVKSNLKHGRQKKMHEPKKQYAEGFTPPYSSGEESVSEGSPHDRFKTEEDQSDDEGHMELDDDLFVRVWIKLYVLHIFILISRCSIMFCYISVGNGSELHDR